MVPTNRSRTSVTRLAAVLIVLVLAVLPAASAYMSISNEANVREKSCYCHDPLPSEDVTIIVRVPNQVSFIPEEDISVNMELGILGEPSNITGIGIILNGTVNSSTVKWLDNFGNAGDPDPLNKVESNGNAIFQTGRFKRQWFNLSFDPGKVNQTLDMTIIGMRSNGNNNESGDIWAILEGTRIEVHQQKLLNITVPVSNKGGVNVGGVLVDFYIDDEFIGNATVDDVPVDGKGNATVSWDVTFIEEGEYTMHAIIDPLGTISELDRDNNEIVRSIWVGDAPSPADMTALYAVIGALVVVAVIVLAFFLYRRRLYRF